MHQFVALLTVGLVVALIFKGLAAIPGWIWITFYALVIAALVLALVFRDSIKEWQRQGAEEEKKRADQFVNQCQRVIDKHLDELTRKRLMFIIDAGYGRRDTTKWDKEREVFINEVLLPHVGPAPEGATLNLEDLVERSVNRQSKRVEPKTL